MNIYRGTIENTILVRKSTSITSENINSIDFDNVIYCEITSLGGMGNEGGIMMYVIDNEDLTIYETNILSDGRSYNGAFDNIEKRKDLFRNYYGGMGNNVYIKKGIQLEIDKHENCFWYRSQNVRLRIDSSVKGVFIRIARELKKSHINV